MGPISNHTVNKQIFSVQKIPFFEPFGATPDHGILDGRTGTIWQGLGTRASEMRRKTHE